MEQIVDLHCHSIFSDGVLTPEELYKRAIAAGVKVFSLTDHDSIAGMDRLYLANSDSNILVVGGIEFSVRWKKYNIHILGLNIDVANLNLVAMIKTQKERRIARAKKISGLLENCGLENGYAKAYKLAQHDNIGRVHFAKLLISEGIVADMQSAFKYYLGENKKAFVPTSWITLAEAISVIQDAGGNAVIAHPLKYKLTRTKLFELIEDFKLAGGEALEVVSGDMEIKDIQMLAKICMRFDLLASSGSDFHGDKMSKVLIGRQKLLPEICTPIWHKWSFN